MILGGIAHKIYRYEIKTNHESLLKKILDEFFPEKAPFSEKKFVYKIGGISNPKKFIQPEFELNEDHFKGIIEETLPKSVKPTKMSQKPIGCECSLQLNTFIPGKRNLLASKACKAVVDMPGVAFNPFIIYGEPGSGKTHLLEGINNELQHYIPEKRTVQVAAEDFLNDFIVHLRTHKMKEFRDSYRKDDAFLLDDLHALLPSSKCQTELLHTINALRKKKAQIVIACQVAPTQIEGLNSGLLGRLESGLTVDIGIPDDQTRIEILKRKAIERSIPLSNDLANFIVKNIEFYSLCEHHMIPFYVIAHIGYIPDGKIIGLSKLARITDLFSQRLQVQERLTNQIAQCLQEVLKPRGVAVVLDGKHFCMLSRGVQKQNSIATSSSMLGIFREKESTRNEFLKLIEMNNI